MKKIFLGSDHAGLELKNTLVENLRSKSKEISVFDLGTNDSSSCHYPNFAINVCQEIKKDLPNSLGILICGSGIGMSIVANRFMHIRAALVRSKEEAFLSRSHNDSNVLCLGQKFTSSEVGVEILDCWLNTQFSGDRHSIRLQLFELLGS